MKNKLLIIGAGGHGKVVADIAWRMDQWSEIDFLDDNKHTNHISGYKVLGNSADYHKYIGDYDIIVGIGDNSIRKKFQIGLESVNASIPTLIHPSAIIGRNVRLGEGTVIMPGAIINTCTKIGKGCVINTASSLDHDNFIGDFVHISPGVHLAGSVKIGECTWLGIGCAVSNDITITNDCTFGAGSVVIKDISSIGTYVGIPAKNLD